MEPYAHLRYALEAVSAAAAAARRGRSEPARPRRDARDGSEVPVEAGRLMFPATVTTTTTREDTP